MRSPKAEELTRTIHILLVDDNRNGLLARTSVLQEHGYQVHAFSSPANALESFKDRTFDVVVTDYRMPEMTGAELIGQLRAINPNVPIILISGVVDVLGLNEKTTGANIVVSKNATEVTHLIRAVKKLLLEAYAPKKPVRSQSAAKPRKRS